MVRASDIGATILRMILGVTFFIHGLSKFQGGIENTAAYFESLGFPGFSAYAVAVIELVGGIAMVFGLGTRIIAVLFALIMVGAIFKAKLAVGFMGNGQMAGYELDLALLAMSVFTAMNKATIALDHVFFTSNARGGNQ